MKAVISQSMYFPWVGLLEQVRLSDVFVHYDDVQFVRGFFNRVKVKMPNGAKYLTVPLKNYHRGQLINEVLIDDSKNWQRQHREILRQFYLTAPYRDEMLQLVDETFSGQLKTLSDVSRESILTLSRYFELSENTSFINSSELNVAGASSQRLRDICLNIAADVYITGHGAKNYLDHDCFECSGIRVEYMDYQMQPYPQLYGEFTPFVSALDLVANCGKEGVKFICSGTLHWKNFIKNDA